MSVEIPSDPHAPAPPSMSEALRGFARMSLADRLLLAAAWVMILAAAAVLKLVAFKRLAPLLGRQVGAVGCVPLADPRQEARARAVRRAVRRAARISPLRNDCLPQALVGAVLCRLCKVPVTTHLGVRLNGEKPFEAHAWTCSGQVEVTGGSCFTAWTPVSCFVAIPGGSIQRQ